MIHPWVQCQLNRAACGEGNTCREVRIDGNTNPDNGLEALRPAIRRAIGPGQPPIRDAQRWDGPPKGSLGIHTYLQTLLGELKPGK